MHITDVEEISEELDAVIAEAMQEAKDKIEYAVMEHNDAVYELEKLQEAMETMTTAIGSNL